MHSTPARLLRLVPRAAVKDAGILKPHQGEGSRVVRSAIVKPIASLHDELMKKASESQFPINVRVEPPRLEKARIQANEKRRRMKQFKDMLKEL